MGFLDNFGFGKKEKVTLTAATMLAANVEGKELPKNPENMPAHETAMVNKDQANPEGVADPSVFMEAQRQVQEKRLQELHEKKLNLEAQVNEENNILNNDSSVRTELFKSFEDHYQATLARLSGKDAKNFAKVLPLPELLEKYVRALASSPQHINHDCTTPEAQEYFKSVLLSYDQKEIGPLVQILQSIINEQNIASPLDAHSKDIGEHAFFSGFHALVIKDVAILIMQERKVKNMSDELAQITQEEQDLAKTLGGATASAQ